MAKYMKTLMAEDIRTRIEESHNILVVGLLPMDASTNVELRANLRGLGANLRVIHNRTSRHALDERRKALADFFTGQTALTLVPGEEVDPVPVAKTLVEAARKHFLEIRGGFVDGEFLDKAGVEFLAQSPDKNTLRGMLAGVILGPARGIAASLQAVYGGLARCVQAHIDNSGETPSES